MLLTIMYIVVIIVEACVKLRWCNKLGVCEIRGILYCKLALISKVSVDKNKLEICEAGYTIE